MLCGGDHCSGIRRGRCCQQRRRGGEGFVLHLSDCGGSHAGARIDRRPRGMTHHLTGAKAMGILSRTTESLGRSNGDGLAQEFNNFVTDVERVAKDLQQLTGSSLAAARSELQGRISRARDSLSDAGRGAAETAVRTRDYVAERPWAAVAVAVAIGALVAIVLSRRSGED